MDGKPAAIGVHVQDNRTLFSLLVEPQGNDLFVDAADPIEPKVYASGGVLPVNNEVDVCNSGLAEAASANDDVTSDLNVGGGDNTDSVALFERWVRWIQDKRGNRKAPNRLGETQLNGGAVRNDYGRGRRFARFLGFACFLSRHLPGKGKRRQQNGK